MTAAVGGIDPVRRRSGDPHPFRVGQLVRLQRGDTGVQDQGGDAHALGHQSGDHLGGERPPRAGHLGAARLGGVDVLVQVDRPRPLDVPVADRSAVDGEPGQGVLAVGVLAQCQPRLPQTAPPTVGTVEAHDGSAGQHETARRRGSHPSPGGPPDHTAGLDHPPRRVEPCRQVDDKRGTVVAHGVDGGGNGPRDVDHHQVAGLEELGEEVERARNQ